MSEEEKAQADNKPAEEVSVPDKFKDLIEGIEKMSVVDLAELVKVLEKKFGVTSAVPMMVAAPVAGEATTSASEKSAYDVILAGVGEKKIEVIKVVRDITGLGLKEAKDIVDAAEKEAQKIKEQVKKEEAEEIKQKLEAAGAKVELK